MICTETLGQAFEPEERFENPDGTQIIFDTDFAGTRRGSAPAAGPLEPCGITGLNGDGIRLF